jgi:hypothetical protein
MTSTLDRPAPARPKPVVRRAVPERSPLGPGMVAAAWAIGAGLVTLGIPVLLAWATDSRSGSGAAAATRSIGQLWLLAHGASMKVPGGTIGMTPLGLVVLPLFLLHRAGRHGARSFGVDSLASGGRLVVAIAFPYGVAAALIATVSATHDVRPAPVQAVLGALLVGVVGATSGVVRAAGLAREACRLPARARRLIRGTLVATASLLAAGSALSCLALLRHAGRASSLAAASDPGLVGGLALLVVGLVCVPNGAVWGAAWLTGPGFAVGVGTAVGPFGTTLGAVPALPLFAALPSAPVPTWVGVLALAFPVAAGALGGIAVARRLSCPPGKAVVEALLLGPCAGVVMTALAWLSSGPLGGGRLADVGPSPWRVGLAVLVEVGAGAAAAAAVVRR